jgi:hypothetical protein
MISLNKKRNSKKNGWKKTKKIKHWSIYTSCPPNNNVFPIQTTTLPVLKRKSKKAVVKSEKLITNKHTKTANVKSINNPTKFKKQVAKNILVFT